MLVRSYQIKPDADLNIQPYIFYFKARGQIIKSIYNLVSHCLPCNSSHNVVKHAIGIIDVFSNVIIVAKFLAKLKEAESSCMCTYNGVGVVIMLMKTRLESTKTVPSTIASE